MRQYFLVTEGRRQRAAVCECRVLWTDDILQTCNSLKLHTTQWSVLQCSNNLRLSFKWHSWSYVPTCVQCMWCILISSDFSFQSRLMSLSCFELFNSPCLVTTVYTRTPEGQKELSYVYKARPHCYQSLFVLPAWRERKPREENGRSWDEKLVFSRFPASCSQITSSPSFT